MIKFSIKLPKINTKVLKKEIDSAFVRALKNSIEEEFNKSIDPYGQKWADKKIPNGRKTLYATGKMRRSFRYSPNGVTNPVKYLKYHQTGTSKMVRRAIYPYGTIRNSLWGKHLDNSVKYVLRRYLK